MSNAYIKSVCCAQIHNLSIAFPCVLLPTTHEKIIFCWFNVLLAEIMMKNEKKRIVDIVST